MVAQKYEIQEFNGVRYYKKPGGYYKSDYVRHGGRYMHRVVWEFHNGPIPENMVVHHKDHDRSNNDIGNLELLSASEHAKYHMAERTEGDPVWWAAGLDKAREAAARWHRDAPNDPKKRAIMSAAAKKSWHGREKLEYVCTYCGKTFLRFRGTNKRGYCSPACQTAARVASGVDDKTRQCVVCGSDFRANKYKVQTTCSASCRHIRLSEATRAWRRRQREQAGEGVRPDGGDSA